MITDNEAQPQFEAKPSHHRANVSAYVRWQPPTRPVQTREDALSYMAAHFESNEFQTFVKLVGKETAYGYIRRVLENTATNTTI